MEKRKRQVKVQHHMLLRFVSQSGTLTRRNLDKEDQASGGECIRNSPIRLAIGAGAGAGAGETGTIPAGHDALFNSELYHCTLRSF